MKINIFRISHLIGVAWVASALTGCISPALIGDHADSVPPKLISLPTKDGAGKNDVIWDRPMAFGPVPSDLQTVGDIACMSARIDLMALGYHPKAQDLGGQSMPGGGYFCGFKPNGDLPGSTPPKLIRVNGQLGWDQPVAFGRVPPSEQARGDAMCAQAQTRLKAAGFHPRALNESGEPITGGGFFCLPR
jgi:hypothetical protein